MRFTPQQFKDAVRRIAGNMSEEEARAALEGNAERRATKRATRRAKHGNVKTERHGQVFDSAHEANVYDGLLLRWRAGDIKDLLRQVPFALVVNDIHVCNYVADFVYRRTDGLRVVVDAKSDHTRRLPVYALKKKLMRACLGIDIVEM